MGTGSGSVVRARYQDMPAVHRILTTDPASRRLNIPFT